MAWPVDLKGKIRWLAGFFIFFSLNIAPAIANLPKRNLLFQPDCPYFEKKTIQNANRIVHQNKKHE